MKRNLLNLATVIILTLISLNVYAQKPNGYVYNPSTVTVTVGSTVNITPTRQSGSTATAFVISPATLPAGLSFSAGTGAITGIPSSVTGQTTFTITPSNSSGNGAVFTLKLTVSKGTITITANDVNKTYGTAITSPGAGSTAFTVTGLAPGDNISTVSIAYGTGATATSNVGTNANQVTPSLAVGTYNAANYNPIVYSKGDIIVGKATLTVTANSQTRTYGANNPAFTLFYSGFVNGDGTAALNTLPTGSTTATTTSNVGVYSITVSGGSDNNYTFAFVAGTLTITQANLTITASNTNKTYGTAVTNPASGSSAFSQTGLVSGTVTVTLNYSSGNAAADPAGTAGTITPSNATGSGFNASNYNITYITGTLTVTTATLTIKANNQTKAYGSAFTFAGTEFTTTGLKNSDAVSSATIASTGAVSSAAAGTHGISIAGAIGTGLSNYTITYTSGTMTVNKLPITVTATGPAPDKYYGTSLGTLTNSSYFLITSGTLPAGESISSVTLNPDGNAQNAYAYAGTTYTMTPSNAAGTGGFVASNYNITYAAYTGTVQQAPITITATGPTKVYGTALNTTTNSTTNFSVTGTMAPGEGIYSVTLTPSGAGITANAPAGTAYTVAPSAAADYFYVFGFPLIPVPSSNYAITYVGFTSGAVTPAPLTVTANAVSKPFGATLTGPVTGSAAFTSTGLKNSETIGSVTITYGTAALPGSAVGSYANQVTASAATGGTFTASNYTITYVSNTLAVVAGIYDWTGASSTNWYTPQNWSVNGVQQTVNYPGLNGTSDAVNIGVVAYSNTANQPTLSANLPNSITTITFGNSETTTLNLAASVALTTSGAVIFNSGSNAYLNGTTGSSLNIGGDYITNNGSTFNNNSSATITIAGVFTNAGTSNFGSSLVTFNNPGNPITFTTSSTQVFTNVLFAGTGHFLLKKTTGPSAGQYNIASNGTLTLTGSVNLTVASAPLTLLSDAAGSASVAAIPSGCQINGTVNVQRYMQAQRGYRLMASPVNNGTSGSNSVYSVNYLKNSAYLTGSAGIPGLFDKAGNPTLFLYREDIIADNSTFITGNYRGISDMSLGNSNPPSYSINNDGPGFNIPASNGYLFYYRGSRNQKTLAQLTTAGASATTDTLTASGSLNVGQIVFRDWYTPGSTELGYSNPDTTIVGFNLAGNPYASSIDWETYNTSAPTTGIYVQNISDYVYELNPVTSNYDIYEAGQGGSVFTNNASRTIVSGQGFFVLATGAGAQLIFNESAKNTALQNTGPNLYMGKPVNTTAANQYMKLQMAMDNINTDDIVIAFNNNTKTSFDLKEDALYKIGTGKVSLSSLSSDRKLLAINRMPLNQKTVTIALKVNSTTNGTYSLNMNALQGVPALYDVWLMDAYRNDSLDMRHNKTYLFDVVKTDTASYGANRFKLVLRQNPAMAYHLLNFTAIKGTGKQVQVAWVTEHEENYTNFTIERSTDGGKTYAVVGGVPSTGAGVYSLLDKNPGENNLYRLKQEDINNSISYSHIIPVGFSNLSNNLAANNINVYPNPVSTAVHMSVSTAVNNASATYNYTITNSYGLLIRQGTSTQSTWQANVSDLMPGTYVIQVVNNKDQSFIGKSKFVKL